MKKRVAMVDDDPDLCRLMELACLPVADRLTLETYSDPVAALDALEHNPPELLLLDVMMPGLSGPQLLEALRKRWRKNDVQVACAFLTAKCMPAELEELRRQGADYVWTKPFTPTQIASQLITALEIPE